MNNISADIYENIDGAVLAGGENSRFSGKVKANMVVGDKPIIQKTLEIMDSVFSATLIITNYSQEFPAYNSYKMFEDIYKKVGPLGGIHSALTHSSAEAVFVVAGDMPGLSGKLIRQLSDYFLVSGCEVLIPSTDGNIEPLHAIYSREILDRLDAYLSAGNNYAIRNFLNDVKVEYLEISASEDHRSSFFNINTPADLEKARRNKARKQ